MNSLELYIQARYITIGQRGNSVKGLSYGVPRDNSFWPLWGGVSTCFKITIWLLASKVVAHTFEKANGLLRAPYGVQSGLVIASLST